MKAATIIADITPKCDVYLVGYAGDERKNLAKGVHDAPLAISLLLELGTEKYLFLSIDTLAIEDQKIDIIKNRITKVIQIKKENIIINAVHSHSLPNGFYVIDAFNTPENPNYFEFVCDKIENSLLGLDKKLVTVTAKVGTTKVHGYYSKRTDITQPFDDNAMLINFYDNHNSIVACICNFNCHATVLGPKNMLISADLIGSVREKMSEFLGVIPLTVTGASGDISNRQYRQGNDFVELDRVGKGVSDILRLINDYKDIDLESLEMRTYNYHVSYDNSQFFSSYRKGIEEAEKVLVKDSISLDEWKMATSEKLSLENKLRIEYVDFYVCGKILKLNDLTIVTFPGELASKFGLELREKCKTPFFLLIGYSEGYHSYFIEQEEYGKTYETKASLLPKGESEKIVQKIGELL